MTTKITPADLRRQAQEMIEAGTMPSLEDVLSAVAKARSKYSEKIIKSRHETDAGESTLAGQSKK